MAGDALNEYVRLMDSFVKGETSAAEFERRYLALFKADRGHHSDAEFRILDRLFADVDAFCGDPSIRSADDLDELELRNRCVEALVALRSLAQRR